MGFRLARDLQPYCLLMVPVLSAGVPSVSCEIAGVCSGKCEAFPVQPVFDWPGKYFGVWWGWYSGTPGERPTFQRKPGVLTLFV